jgi:hypothetical protein
MARGLLKRLLMRSSRIFFIAALLAIHGVAFPGSSAAHVEINVTAADVASRFHADSESLRARAMSGFATGYSAADLIDLVVMDLEALALGAESLKNQIRDPWSRADWVEEMVAEVDQDLENAYRSISGLPSQVESDSLLAQLKQMARNLRRLQGAQL